MNYNKLQLHTEPLDEDELAFLQRREEKEQKEYYRIYKVVMVVCFIIPFAGAWYKASDGVANAFSAARFFIMVFILLAVSSFGMWAFYRRSLYKLSNDIRQRTKTIELSRVIRKQYMPQNNTYFFYIDSPNRLSIEVTQDEFYNLDMGDEVNVEYASYSKIYLGHF